VLTDSRALAPTSALPLAYFACAHIALAVALAVVALTPGMAAGVFYQPRVIALVHLVTVGWLTGSILGAFYIVGPLALGIPMRVRWIDWTAFAFFAVGAAGMASHFWIATYDGMAWSAAMVVVAVLAVAARACRGRHSRLLTTPVSVHLSLAVFNFMGAAVFGILIGVDRSRGLVGLGSIPAVYAHAHLAAIGWVMLMVIGLSYRLLPMMVPAAMPSGRGALLSALFIETGLTVLFLTLLEGSDWLMVGAVLIVAGIAAFVGQIGRIIRSRRPRPPALPRRDWSTWQTQAAMVWLLIAAGTGFTLAAGGYGDWRTPTSWIYGVAGLIGFLSQMVAGVQGRIVPLYAWYRARAALGRIPSIAANALPSASFSQVVFTGWAIGVPLLAVGLGTDRHLLIRGGALGLISGVLAGALHIHYMMKRARTLRVTWPSAPV
jgi:hypothetical protein